MLSALSDALVALGRIGTFLTSDDLPEAYPIDKSLPSAVKVDGTFVWETVGKPVTDTTGKGKPGIGGGRGGPGGKGNKEPDAKAVPAKAGKRWWQRKGKDEKGAALPSTAADVENEKAGIGGHDPAEKAKEEKEKPFELKDLKFDIPKGAFIGIVGRVGCGKASTVYIFSVSPIDNSCVELCLTGVDR